MKHFALLIFLQVLHANAQKKDSIPDPFLNLKYDKVVIYNMNLIRDSTGTRLLHYPYKPAEERFSHLRSLSSMGTLDSGDVKNLIKLLSDPKTFGGDNLACFEPRMGITFFNGNEEVMSIYFCLDCSNLESYPLLPAVYNHPRKIEIEDNQVSLIYDRGFSENGLKALKALCAKYLMYCSH